MNPSAIHPDYPHESRKLEEVLDTVSRETTLTTQKEKEQALEVEDLRKHTGGVYSPELFVKETIYRHTVQTLRNLKLAKSKPYFTRIDFRETKKTVYKYYIGKYGILDSHMQEPIVIDWRSPIANLYYSGQTGAMDYLTPDGKVSGELLLKRQFGIRDGKIETIFDTGVVSQDVYLQSVLGEHANERLKDIVTTIQKEQNDIIRAPKDQPLIVQGVAGSGKTTIALHRIAYLLYTYQDELAPENMMILAPNPLFLDYISEVLPELGVEDVLQTTFESLAEKLTGKKLPKLTKDDKLIYLLDQNIQEDIKDDLIQVSQFKSSLLYKECLDAYLSWLEQNIVPKEDVKIGPVMIYSYEEMQRFFLDDISPFPFTRRIAEVKKHIGRKAKQAIEQIVKAIERECDYRIELLKRKVPEGEERRQRVIRIYGQRDLRIKEAQNAEKPFVEKYMNLWPKLDLLDCYRQMFSGKCFPLPAQVDEELWEKVCLHSLEILGSKSIETEDLAPLIHMCRKTQGLSDRLRIHHTILDEAQDFSLFQLDLLKSLTGNASFSIVGDLSQGIHAYRGVQDWKKAMAEVFKEDRPNYLTLIQSYRNTVEIMEIANEAARGAPYADQVLAKPVLRHGQPPQIIPKASSMEVLQSIKDQIEKLIEEGYKTIAVIGKTPESCREIYNSLKKQLTLPLQLLTPKDQKYHGGVMIIPSYLAKGLEFDVVIMADVSDKTFGANPLDARLLYVCLTRPLHRLYCYHTGSLTPLLEHHSK